MPKELGQLARPYLNKEKIIYEPQRRNTGPAICLGAMVIIKKYGDGILHIIPADHLIQSEKKFINCLRFGERLAEKGLIITYGIKPTRPETGYGYIKLGKKIYQQAGLIAFRAQKFTEKPQTSKARKYLRSGRYLWNSGIFTFRASDIVAEIKKYVPEVYNGVGRYLTKKAKKYYGRVPNISIDYAVMEKSNRIATARADFQWGDVGSWLALERYFKKDRMDNIIKGDAKGLEIYNTIMYNDYTIPLRVYGVQDLIIVAGQKGILVCNKRYAPDLKKLLFPGVKKRKGG